MGGIRFKLKKLKEIVEGVWRYNVESNFHVLAPRSVMINLTYKCNSRCVMCNIWKMRPKSELDYKDWQKVMEDPIFGEIRVLSISGGEPSLNSEYVKTIKMFVDKMPKLRRLVINTNGFVPERIVKGMEEIAKHCRERKIKLAPSISIDGVGAMHDKIRRIPNGFDKCVKTLEGYKKLAKKYELSVGVSSVLMRQNVGEFQKMLDWFAKNKIEGGFQVVGFHDTYLRNTDTEDEVGISSVRSKFVEVLGKIRDTKKPWSFGRYYWEDMINMYRGGVRTTPCSFLMDDFVVDSLGDVYYCLSVRPIGNILREKRRVGEIYCDPKNLKFRKQMSLTYCRKCNSGCNVADSIAFDAKKYLWYKLTGRLWPVKVANVG